MVPRQKLEALGLIKSTDWNISKQKQVGTPEKTQTPLWFTSCGYVWHTYVSGGNELQDLLHILPAFLFVSWSNIHFLQHFPSCQFEWDEAERQRERENKQLKKYILMMQPLVMHFNQCHMSRTVKAWIKPYYMVCVMSVCCVLQTEFHSCTTFWILVDQYNEWNNIIR